MIQMSVTSPSCSFIAAPSPDAHEPPHPASIDAVLDHAANALMGMDQGIGCLLAELIGTMKTIEQALEKCDIIWPTGCWQWRQYLNPDGYGQAWVNGVRGLVHRFVYQHLRGEIPDGMVIDHLCRNRACVNPDHMEVVTQRTNVIRGNGSAGIKARQTHCKNGHPLNGENLYYYKGRRCRTCHRNHEKARRHQKRQSDQIPSNATPLQGDGAIPHQADVQRRDQPLHDNE